MTDGRTDGLTELRWLRRAIAVPAVARKNLRAYVIMTLLLYYTYNNILMTIGLLLNAA